MRGKKVKQMRRDLRAYDAAHPVLAVLQPRSWYGKLYWIVRTAVVQVVRFSFRRPGAPQPGKVIRLEPKFRDLKKAMRRKPLV